MQWLGALGVCGERERLGCGWRTDAQESLLSSTHFSARWSSCPKKSASSAVFQPSGLGGGGGEFLSFSAFCSAVSGVWGNCQRDRASISLDCRN